MKHTTAVKHAITLPGEWSVCADIVVALIEPPQGAVIEKILPHSGLWHPATPRVPPPEDDWVYGPVAERGNQSISSEEPDDMKPG